ncbi:MAG TPA: heme ABC transporter permease [Afifellaceae bacterium]|nr:heme ABC transporter permease [Afifellaceae bacterium]
MPTSEPATNTAGDLAGDLAAKPTIIGQLANPTRFLGLSEALLPWLVSLAAACLAVGLYLAFFVAPADYQQGDSVRIMFIHVPAAWLAMFCYSMMAVAALGTLVWKHPLADVAAKAAAPLGAAFTLLALLTGSIWGKPMWGTWWVWDARLTSVLVLFIMYLGLIALWRSFDDPGRAGRVAAVLTLVGFINIPIIKFSVDWWNTLHQPASVVRLDGPTIHPTMLWPLIIMAIGFTLALTALHLGAMRAEIYRRRVRTAQIMIAQRHAPAAAPAAVSAKSGPR